MTTDEAFGKHDADKDGKLTRDEAPTPHAVRYIHHGPGLRQEYLRDEWDYYKAAMESDNGMLAIKSAARAT